MQVPPSDAFLRDDVIEANTTRASSTVFTFPEALQNGRLVPPQQSRALYLRFQAPSQTGIRQQQTVQVIVTAEMP